MPDRTLVEQERLVYSCNCGWLDLSHLDPSSPRPGLGAQDLWRQITAEAGKLVESNGLRGFVVSYRQEMALKLFGSIRIIEAAHSRQYVVRHRLSNAQKERVALAIFAEVSLGFEDLQGRFPWSVKTAHSSFSEEDLVSNLVGFYKAVRPGFDYLKLCGTVSKAASLDVWDRAGPVGSRKNRTFTPLFRPCADCKGPPAFPHALQAISPAKKGELFSDYQPPKLPNYFIK